MGGRGERGVMFPISHDKTSTIVYKLNEERDRMESNICWSSLDERGELGSVNLETLEDVPHN